MNPRKSMVFHHTPMEVYRPLFYSVLKAGHGFLAPDHPMRSWSYPGHDFLYSRTGSSAFEMGGRIFTINEGEYAWIDNNHQNVRWLSRPLPWEFFAVRVDSKTLDSVAENLNVQQNPIFKPVDIGELERIYLNVFEILKASPITMDVKLHVEVSSLVAISFEARLSGEQQEEQQSSYIALGVGKVLDAIRAQYDRRWKIREFAQIMGSSEPQLFRRFKQATGATPMDWLRRERINHAKRRLAETQDRVSLVSQNVGYNDPLHFSRDFKKIVGVSPRNYREREQI